ncbi:hypothetical protein ENSA5_61650 [Enhygromyxa salina]|uniref:Uncharacterized protein n=1 Tax=Enhygromyxa salina TaxID=215803 RepID=A0A2S9XDH0_9BACT|nr:DUF4215 domain-containing protein [Enhygromyxa salina]PRP90731.1 hypothetical protein ENSA5_61650 [Enhygromyxa salina]
MSMISSRPWVLTLVVGALLSPACGDSSASDGSGDGDGESGPGDGGPGDGDPGDGDPGDGDPGDGDPGDGDPGDGDPGDGDGEPGDGDGDPPPGCGDGQLDPGEACDDGNNVPGDGCSASCQLPGELIWEVFVDIDEQLGDDVGYEVVVDGDGSIGVLVESDASSYRLAKFDLDGNPLWSVSSLATDKPSLVRTPEGGLVVGGRLGSQGATRSWDAEGNSDWTTLVDSGSSGVLGVAADAQGFVVSAGYHDANGVLARYDPEDLNSWSQLQPLSGELGPVGVSPSGDIWVVRTETATLESYDSDGNPGPSVAGLEGDIFEEITIAPDGAVYVLAQSQDQSSFTLGKYERGAKVWTQVHSDVVPNGASGLGRLPGGGFVVAGYTNGTVDTSDALLSWFDADGGVLADDVVIDNAEVDVLHDVAVTPYNYAVAVGTHIAAGEDADLWIRKFEI